MPATPVIDDRCGGALASICNEYSLRHSHQFLEEMGAAADFHQTLRLGPADLDINAFLRAFCKALRYNGGKKYEKSVAGEFLLYLKEHHPGLLATRGFGRGECGSRLSGMPLVAKRMGIQAQWHTFLYDKL